MIETKIFLTNKQNEKLVGIRTMPLTEINKFPTIILVHGFGVTKEEGGMFDDIAKNLCKAGFLVFRFDFSGCGESEGDYRKTSLSKLKSNLSEIIKFVKSQPETDASNMGILAQSFGTTVTIALEPEVKCLAMMGAISHPKEVIAKLFGKNYSPNGVSILARSNGLETKVDSRFWDDLDRYNLLNSIKNIDAPILFIHGEKDDKVPLSEMENYFNNANEPKEKIILEKADHGLIPCRDQMQKILTSFFKKYLNP